MNVGIAILIILLLVLASVMRIGGGILLLVFLCVVGWLAITMLVRFALWAAGHRQVNPGSGAGAAGRELKKVCPDSRCGRVNEERARFCAQCGRRLP